MFDGLWNGMEYMSMDAPSVIWIGSPTEISLMKFWHKFIKFA